MSDAREATPAELAAMRRAVIAANVAAYGGSARTRRRYERELFAAAERADARARDDHDS